MRPPLKTVIWPWIGTSVVRRGGINAENEPDSCEISWPAWPLTFGVVMIGGFCHTLVLPSEKVGRNALIAWSRLTSDCR